MTKAVTLFKNLEGTEFFHYDHLAGVLTIIINDGPRKGIMVRYDSKSAQLARQFNREQEHGVPYDIRIFNHCTIEEFHHAYTFAVEAVHQGVLEALQS